MSLAIETMILRGNVDPDSVRFPSDLVIDTDGFIVSPDDSDTDDLTHTRAMIATANELRRDYPRDTVNVRLTRLGTFEPYRAPFVVSEITHSPR